MLSAEILTVYKVFLAFSGLGERREERGERREERGERREEGRGEGRGEKGLRIFRTQRRGCRTGVGVVSLCLHSRKISLQTYKGKSVLFIDDLSPPDHWKSRLPSQQEEIFHNMLKGKRALT